MKRSLLAIVLVFFPFLTFSQKAPIKYGSVPMEDMTMSVYPHDSSASAVVLADFGTSKISYKDTDGFVLTFERVTRIKIIDKTALNYANFEVPLYHSNGEFEKLKVLRGVTSNLEGGKIVETKLKDDGIFKEKATDNWQIVKVTMPNVKEGSVIDLHYEIDSEFIMNFQDWEFQREIPTRWSEYRAVIPEYFKYLQYMQGYTPLIINEQQHGTNSMTITLRADGVARGGKIEQETTKFDFVETSYRWAAEKVPSFSEELYITTPNDYITKINFELASTHMPGQEPKPVLGSWDEINYKFLENWHFGEEITGNAFLNKTVEEIVAGKTSEEEKALALVDFIRRNFAWNNEYRVFPSMSMKKTVEGKKGASSDLNLLLLSMLHKAGIKSNPVLISTRNHGFVRENIPVANQFNHLVSFIVAGDKSFMVDATEKLLPIGVLPEQCLNGRGLALSKEGPRWIPLDTKTKTKRTTSVELSMGQSGRFEGKARIDHAGYAARNQRAKLIVEGKEEYLKSVSKRTQWEITASDYQFLDDIRQPFKESYEWSMDANVQASGDRLYIDPFVTDRIKENPFRSKKRDYPVDFAIANEELYLCKFKIPAGFVVEELPANKIFGLPNNGGRYTFNITQNGDVLSITSMLSINQPLYSQIEYPNLREFFNQVVAKQAEQIVLKKQ